MYGAEQATEYSIQQLVIISGSIPYRYKYPFHLYPFYAHTYIFPLMQYISGEGDGDDDNLIVFPPKADDNSCVYNFSISERSARLTVPQMVLLATSER